MRTHPTTSDGVLARHTATMSQKEYASCVVDSRLPHALLWKGTAYVDIHASYSDRAFVVVRSVDGDTTTVKPISGSTGSREEMHELLDAAVAGAQRENYPFPP